MTRLIPANQQAAPLERHVAQQTVHTTDFRPWLLTDGRAAAKTDYAPAEEIIARHRRRL